MGKRGNMDDIMNRLHEWVVNGAFGTARVSMLFCI